ncbi:hypothetical protein D3C73_1139120 [compost metagenome]
MCVYICGYKHFCPVFLGKLNTFAHFLKTEIICIGTKAIMLSPDIYSISTVVNGEFQFFEVAGWRKQFGLIQAIPLPAVLRGVSLRCLHLRSPLLLILLLIHLFFVEKAEGQLPFRVLNLANILQPRLIELIIVRILEIQIYSLAISSNHSYIVACWF